jgi:response regulator RpfG family c-di-GMP phosphodiesterase
MPGMDGAEFLEKARAMCPDSVRIILTGYADTTTAIDAINKGGAYRYIAKPWNDEELRVTIKDAVGRHRLIKENIRLTGLTKQQNEELKKWSSELEMYVQEQTIELTKQNEKLDDLNRKLTKNLRAFIISFSNLIEFRDKNVSNHSNTVAKFSREIAHRIGLSEKETTEVAIASQLHDIGKIGMADILFLKQIDDYSPEEVEEYRRHPVRGQTAIGFIEDFHVPGIFIRHHHEAFGGNGFPDGLKGNAIPTGSRIIAMADAYDRLLNGKNRRFEIDVTLSEIKGLLHKQFDPALFPFLCEVAGEMASERNFVDEAPEGELSPDVLIPGMILSRDVKSGSGFLLLCKGSVLSKSSIDSIKRCHDFDPSKTGVYVISERNKRDNGEVE